MNRATEIDNMALYHLYLFEWKGYTELGFVHVMLDKFQPLRHQLSQNLLPPQYDLCPRLQIQDTEVGLTHRGTGGESDKKLVSLE